MKRHNFARSLLALVLCAVVLLSGFPMARAAENTTNRYNVVILMDASGSLRSTDPESLRFEAVRLFVELLAEKGNYLGCVVFNTDVIESATQAPMKVQGYEEKQAVLDKIESVQNTNEWTNVGAGLERAVQMLQTNGDPNLPSFILYFGDGITELKTQDEINASRDRKGKALIAAQNAGIKIHTVCLNVNNKANMKEIKDLSDGTGGEPIEVKDAEDLRDAFEMFYNLIYGTTTVSLVDGTYPASGELREEFTIPGLGVEEVNIIIYGKVEDIQIEGVNGEKSNMLQREPARFSDCTFLKLTNVVPGDWVLVTRGEPGSQVKINMVYNPDLQVDMGITSQQGDYQPGADYFVNPSEALTITATLRDDEIVATEPAHFTGFKAAVQVWDAKGNLCETIPMKLVNDHYEVEQNFEVGNYYFSVDVTGNLPDKEDENKFNKYMSTSSDLLGPIVVSTEVPPKNNQPPQPVEQEILTKIHVFPWSGVQSYTQDMMALVTDEDPAELEFVVTSTFPGDAYTITNNVIEVPEVELGGGAFVVRAIDKWGKDCQVRLVIETVNWTLWGVVVLGIGIFLALLIVGIIIFRERITPFRGTIEVTSNVGGALANGTLTPPPGRCKLLQFRVGNVGLDPMKSYFQAGGGKFILLRTNKKVVYNGQEVKEVRIASGASVTVRTVDNQNASLTIRFTSKAPNMGGFGGGGGGFSPRRNTPTNGAGRTGFGGGGNGGTHYGGVQGGKPGFGGPKYGGVQGGKPGSGNPKYGGVQGRKK